MKTIILYGELRKRFGKFHKFNVSTPAEAIRALKANFKGFEKFMMTAHKDGLGFRVFVGRNEMQDLNELHNPLSEKNTFRIIPVIIGSGGVFRVILGAALIIGGVVASAYGMPQLGAGMISAGVGLLIGGIASLLATPPDGPKETSRKNSWVFQGPVNTASQGAAIPVGYGELIVGSVVISAGIESIDF